MMYCLIKIVNLRAGCFEVAYDEVTSGLLSGRTADVVLVVVEVLEEDLK